MSLAQPESILLGYVSKRIELRPTWLDVPTVHRICSASGCVSSAAIDYDTMFPNTGSCYDSPALAREAQSLECDSFEGWVVHAHRLFLAMIDEDREPSTIRADRLLGPDHGLDSVEPLNSSFRSLGFDVAQMEPHQSAKGGFAPCMPAIGCSPLSCNHRAKDFDVNEHCLLRSWNEALRAGRDFANGGGEPPPYVIIEVFEQVGDAAAGAVSCE